VPSGRSPPGSSRPSRGATRKSGARKRSCLCTDQALAAAAVAEATGAYVRQTAGTAHEKKGGLGIVLDETGEAIPVIGADLFLAGATRRPRGKVGGVFTRRLAALAGCRGGNAGNDAAAGYRSWLATSACSSARWGPRPTPT
jgi:hypothetical protein